MNNSTPGYLQGFHDGKIKAESNINDVINYLNHDIKYSTIYNGDGHLTPTIIIDINEFKKIIKMLKK